jgi:hypothetical protein
VWSTLRTLSAYEGTRRVRVTEEPVCEIAASAPLWPVQPNFTVRPGTWVTDQPGHIGYTLLLSWDLATGIHRSSNEPNSRSVSTWFKSHDTFCLRDARRSITQVIHSRGVVALRCVITARSPIVIIVAAAVSVCRLMPSIKRSNKRPDN